MQHLNGIIMRVAKDEEYPMRVEVIYARAGDAFREQLELDETANVQCALDTSQLWQHYPELDRQAVRFGIYGKLVTGETVLKDTDRIEIYRPLKVKSKKQK